MKRYNELAENPHGWDTRAERYRDDTGHFISEAKYLERYGDEVAEMEAEIGEPEEIPERDFPRWYESDMPVEWLEYGDDYVVYEYEIGGEYE